MAPPSAKRWRSWRNGARNDRGHAAAIAARVDQLGPFAGFDGPDQDRGGEAFGLGHRIEQPVHAVGEVDIGDARAAIHDCRAGRPAGAGMAGQVLLADVRFGFSDHAAQAHPIQHAHQL